MGCSASKDGSNLREQYQQAGMTEPWSNQYDNDFEKELFMAINLFRHSPSKIVTFVKDLKRLMPKEFKSDSSLIKDACDKLREMKPLNPIQFSDAATAACKQNNDEIIMLDRYNPKEAGKIDYYTKNLSNDNSEAKEFTIVTNWTESVMHLVAYQILQYFKDLKKSDKKKRNLNYVADIHPLISDKLVNIGISYRGHKKIENIIMI